MPDEDKNEPSAEEIARKGLLYSKIALGISIVCALFGFLGLLGLA